MVTKYKKIIIIITTFLTALFIGCSGASYLEYKTVREKYPEAEIVESGIVNTYFFVRTEDGEVLRVLVDGNRIVNT
jgi:hypothetical protein